jgi:hypothetical protein
MKEEQFKSVCKNPWCKSTFYYTESDMIIEKGLFGRVNKLKPPVCNKCKSFDNELSGGVTWTDKTYEGSRFDNTPHQISYKVTKWK